MYSQIDIRDACESYSITHPKEDVSSLDKYYSGVIVNIEDYFSNPDNKRTPTIKREYFDIKNKINEYHKMGEISDSIYDTLKKKIKVLDRIIGD